LFWGFWEKHIIQNLKKKQLSGLTTALQETLKLFDETDDIYIGIGSAIEKLKHFSMHLALILNPTKKVQCLKDSMEWKDGWVNTLMDYFRVAFDHYREIQVDVDATAPSISVGISKSWWLWAVPKKTKDE
jgi:hypothetical protein